MRSLIHPFLTLALALGSSAQSGPIDDLSFGHKNGISPNSFAIPGWTMLGEGHVPQLLSDKVILTPPYGTAKRGSLIGENPNKLDNWQVDFDFRVGVTDRGVGNLQLWYAANAKDAVGTNSIYTVGKFDGLAIVVDTVGGKQKIRGFLNDGTTDYSKHDNVDSLVFGHCDYAYRNLGRPSQLRIKSTSSGFEVVVDDKPCFSTGSVRLPKDYYFGITAASLDPPDSFEVFKFALSETTAPPPIQQQQQQQQQQNSNPQARDTSPGQPAGQALPADLASLTARLDTLTNSINTLTGLIEKQSQLMGQHYEGLFSQLSSQKPGSGGSGAAVPQPQLTNLESRISDLGRTLNSLESELKSSDHKAQFAKLSQQIQKVDSGVTEHVPQRLREYMIAHTPRIGFILYSFMAFQTLCVGAWVWYKYRKSTMPKKYL